MNARAINSGSTLARWERRFARALLVAVALAGAVLGGIAHAQITFRSANSAGHSAAPVPTFVNAGAVAAGTGAITPALPANIAVDDILLLFLETSNQAISIANQSGGTWTAVLNSPQSTGTAAGADGARLTVFWSRYNGTQTAPVTNDSGDHQLGRIIAVRGVMASGNPWDVTAGGVEAGNTDTSGSIPGTNTTVANTLVVAAIATALPDSTTTTVFSGWTNAGLAGVTERTDNSTTSGNGGGLGIATGTRAATGAYGATTVTTSASTAKAMMSIALRPATAALTINTPAGTAANDVMIASVGFRVESPGQYSTDIDVTAPPGWTLVRRLDNLNSTGSGLAIYQRVAVAGEPASHTWFFLVPERIRRQHLRHIGLQRGRRRDRELHRRGQRDPHRRGERRVDRRRVDQSRHAERHHHGGKHDARHLARHPQREHVAEPPAVRHDAGLSADERHHHASSELRSSGGRGGDGHEAGDRRGP